MREYINAEIEVMETVSDEVILTSGPYWNGEEGEGED